MAEGIDPTDPTTEKTPLIPGTGDDDDDGIDWEAPIDLDPEDPDGEMTNLPQEQSGRGESIPKAPEYADFVYTEEEKETLVNRLKELIKAKFPNADQQNSH